MIYEKKELVSWEAYLQGNLKVEAAEKIGFCTKNVFALYMYILPRSSQHHK